MKNKGAFTVFIALLAMAFWGSIFSCIKLGYSAFSIDTGKPANILLFAAMRFLICGVIVCAYCFIRRKKYKLPSYKDVFQISAMGVFQIFLHYTCTYIGLSMIESSKTALLKQLGTLLYVSFAFLFFKDEKFNIFKIFGVVLGLGGIIAMNSSGGVVSFGHGSLLIIAASFCTVVSAIMSKKSVKNAAPLWVTGISQLFGGTLLMATGFIMGGSLPAFDPKGALILFYICVASISGYTLWYYVVGKIELSALFIIKFAEPVFACIFAAIILSENIFKIQYLAGFLLVSTGIVLGSRKHNNAEDKT